MSGLSETDTLAVLNAQTGRIGWNELARHFARGVVVTVHPAEDLLQLGRQMIADDSAALSTLMAAGRISKATDDDARQWQQQQPEFWALVVAPWVLVQPLQGNDEG